MHNGNDIHINHTTQADKLTTYLITDQTSECIVIRADLQGLSSIPLSSVYFCDVISTDNRSLKLYNIMCKLPINELVKSMYPSMKNMFEAKVSTSFFSRQH